MAKSLPRACARENWPKNACTHAYSACTLPEIRMVMMMTINASATA